MVLCRGLDQLSEIANTIRKSGNSLLRTMQMKIANNKENQLNDASNTGT